MLKRNLAIIDIFLKVYEGVMFLITEILYFLRNEYMIGHNQRDRVLFLLILGTVLAYQLFTTLAVQGDERYSGGTTYNITDVDGFLLYIEGDGTVVNFDATYSGLIFVSPDSPGATLNFRGDSCANLISAGPGSYVNIYGGTVDFLVSVEPDAHVTIYGEKFTVYDELKRTTSEYQPGKKLSVTRAIVTAYNKWGSKFFTGRVSCVPNAFVLLDTESENLNVQIDVKPESNPSVISLYSEDVVPVAILSNETFDVKQVLPDSVRFAGARVASKNGKPMANAEDVDKDGDDDMVFHFKIDDLKLEDGVTKAVVKLTGQLKSKAAGQSANQTNDRVLITGTDTIFIMRSKNK
jgi:hypothetical protein